MQLFIVRWTDQDADKFVCTSSYSTAQKKFKEILKESKKNSEISVKDIDEAIEIANLKSKTDVIALINRLNQ